MIGRKTRTFVLAILLSACSGGNYPEDTRDGFIVSCTGGDPSRQPGCDCAFDHIEEHVSWEDYKSAVDEWESGGPTPDFLFAAQDACNL